MNRQRLVIGMMFGVAAGTLVWLSAAIACWLVTRIVWGL